MALVAFMIWYSLHRREQARREKERQFRVGNISSPVNFQHRSNTPFSGFDQWRSVLGAGGGGGTNTIGSRTEFSAVSPRGAASPVGAPAMSHLSYGGASRIGPTGWPRPPQSASGRSLGQSVTDMIDTDFLSVRS